jgi:hypothetical protein
MPKLGQRDDPIDRFIRRVEITDACWPYQGHINHDGYGRFWLDKGTSVYAHCFAWETFVGPRTPGLELDHVREAGCTDRSCVNPDHLEEVTHRENIRRAVTTGKSHCVHGHPMTPDNTRITAVGRRRCRICDRESSRRQRAKTLAA